MLNKQFTIQNIAIVLRGLGFFFELTFVRRGTLFDQLESILLWKKYSNKLSMKALAG